MTACGRLALEQGSRRKRMVQVVSKPDAINEVAFMKGDRHVEPYIARAHELRRQYLANLVRQAWAGLGKLAVWFNESEERERDEFLSKAANHADVDRRLRVWEDRHWTDPKLSPE
jgi:hypothetical protein